jgi:hypothetical protein
MRQDHLNLREQVTDLEQRLSKLEKQQPATHTNSELLDAFAAL